MTIWLIWANWGMPLRVMGSETRIGRHRAGASQMRWIGDVRLGIAAIRAVSVRCECSRHHQGVDFELMVPAVPMVLLSALRLEYSLTAASHA